MCRNQLGEEFDGISSDIAALVLQTSRGEFCCGLPPFWELGVQIAKLDEDLDGATSTVGIQVQESLLQNIEKYVDLSFGVL